MEHGAGGSEVAPRSPFVPTCGACLGHGVGQTLPEQAQGTCRGYWYEVLGTLGQPVGWGGHREGQLVLQSLLGTRWGWEEVRRVGKSC